MRDYRKSDLGYGLAVLVASLFALATAGSAAAQGRSESLQREIGGELRRERNIDRSEQQQRFENNDLRMRQQRIEQFPALTGPNARRGCPPGAGC